MLTLLTSGEYSDYEAVALVDWLIDKTPREVVDEYSKEFPDQVKPYEFGPSKFTAWLIRKGYAKEVDCNEFHLDYYGCVDDDPDFKAMNKE